MQYLALAALTRLANPALLHEALVRTHYTVILYKNSEQSLYHPPIYIYIYNDGMHHRQPNEIGGRHLLRCTYALDINEYSNKTRAI